MAGMLLASLSRSGLMKRETPGIEQVLRFEVFRCNYISVPVRKGSCLWHDITLTVDVAFSDSITTDW